MKTIFALCGALVALFLPLQANEPLWFRGVPAQGQGEWQQRYVIRSFEEKLTLWVEMRQKAGKNWLPAMVREITSTPNSIEFSFPYETNGQFIHMKTKIEYQELDAKGFEARLTGEGDAWKRDRPLALDFTPWNPIQEIAALEEQNREIESKLMVLESFKERQRGEIVLEVTEDEITAEGQAFTPAQMKEKLKQIGAMTRQVSIKITAPEHTPWTKVVEAMTPAQDAGLLDISFATTKPEK